VIRVVVVTDRRLCDDMPARIATMLASAPRGSVLIQIREKDLDGGPLLQLAHAVIAVARPAGAPVWINDRVDVALAAGADGVHLPARGLSIADARAAAAAIERTVSIGCSRHTAAAVLEAMDLGAELVQYGPIWATPGKGPPLGIEALKLAPRAKRRSTGPPLAMLKRKPPPPVTPRRGRLVAVGGIDGPARARTAALAGADAVAVIRAAWQSVPDVIGKLVEAVDAGVRAR
jgi:thiamine-phosphate pyrophosphorylase